MNYTNTALADRSHYWNSEKNAKKEEGEEE